jgi:hypothetical protein
MCVCVYIYMHIKERERDRFLLFFMTYAHTNTNSMDLYVQLRIIRIKRQPYLRSYDSNPVRYKYIHVLIMRISMCPYHVQIRQRLLEYYHLG